MATTSSEGQASLVEPHSGVSIWRGWACGSSDDLWPVGCPFAPHVSHVKRAHFMLGMTPSVRPDAGPCSGGVTYLVLCIVSYVPTVTERLSLFVPP